jgi:hypothetical protein
MPSKPTGRPPGRPRVEEPGRHIATYIRTSDYDRLVRLALKHDRPVSAVFRDLLLKRLGEREQEP